MSLGFDFDATRCVGCKACQVACKDRLDIQKAGPRPRRVDTYEVGAYPDARLYHVSVGCNHCESPACTAVCPTGAMFKVADGTVLHDDGMCIQCQQCVAACPYGAPQVVEEFDSLIVKCGACLPVRAFPQGVRRGADARVARRPDLRRGTRCPGGFHDGGGRR